jgi:hypothetical protein
MQQIRKYLDGCSKLLQQQQVCNQISFKLVLVKLVDSLRD